MRGVQDLVVDPFETDGDEVTVFSAGSVGEIRRWRVGVKRAEEVGVIRAHETSVYKLVFDSDGDLWSASADASVVCLGRERGKGWEVEMRVEVGGWVRGVGVEERGGWVVAGGRGEGVGVWARGVS